MEAIVQENRFVISSFTLKVWETREHELKKIYWKLSKIQPHNLSNPLKLLILYGLKRKCISPTSWNVKQLN